MLCGSGKIEILSSCTKLVCCLARSLNARLLRQQICVKQFRQSSCQIFTQIGVDLIIVNMWFKFFSLPLQVLIQILFCSLFGSWHVLFLRNSGQTLAEQKFSAILSFSFCQPWTITNSPWLRSQSKFRICNSP